jgi:hypothetical protein
MLQRSWYSRLLWNLALGDDENSYIIVKVIGARVCSGLVGCIDDLTSWTVRFFAGPSWMALFLS